MYRCLFVQAIFISAFLIFFAGRTSRGPGGAWQKFERGELSLFSFYEQFGRDLSDTDNGNKWYTEYCARKKIGMVSYTRTFLGEYFYLCRIRAPDFTCDTRY
jgi:hypothetical protein